MTECAAAVDLGGTKIAAAVVDSDGQIIYQARYPTIASAGRDAVLQRLRKAIEEVVGQSGIPLNRLKGIGVAVPGAVDVITGKVSGLVNLPGWEQFPLGKFFRENYDLPVLVENDANAAAVGENRFGAGHGCEEMLYVTISTGIGGGMIIGGRLTRGNSGAAGEIGHMVLQPGGRKCKCGNCGCWEAISSGTAIAEEAERRMLLGESSLVASIAGGRTVTAEDVFQALEEGDRLASEVVQTAMDFSGLAIANLVNILNPQRVVIGGGVSNVGEVLFSPVREKVALFGFGSARKVVILPAELGPGAGVVGIAELVFESRARKGN